MKAIKKSKSRICVMMSYPARIHPDSQSHISTHPTIHASYRSRPSGISSFHQVSTNGHSAYPTCQARHRSILSSVCSCLHSFFDKSNPIFIQSLSNPYTITSNPIPISIHLTQNHSPGNPTHISTSHIPHPTSNPSHPSIPLIHLPAYPFTFFIIVFYPFIQSTRLHPPALSMSEINTA